MFINDTEKVSKHAFFPLLSYEIKARRFQKKRDPKTGKVERLVSNKIRPIKVASHRDTYIYTHYNEILSRAYEQQITGTEIDECVVAYRKGKGSNIDIALDAFEKIKNLGECVVIAADLKSFFETIDHDHLKEKWAQLLELRSLPSDHYNVFRSLTKYSEISVDALKKKLRIKSHEALPKPIFEDLSKFRKVVKTKGEDGKNMIVRNNHSFGIPQGSPMSALLSNIIMHDFDVIMAGYTKSKGGFYRRYSDDILVVVSQDHFEEALENISLGLNKIPGPLRENEDKRVVSFFNANGDLITGKQVVNSSEVNSRILQYLGFLFDGKEVSIRSQTLARYWRKATRGIRAAKRRAAKNPLDKRVYKRKLLRRFTHLGRMNLHTYKLDCIAKFKDGKIRKQFSNNWRQIWREINGPIKRSNKPSRNAQKNRV